MERTLPWRLLVAITAGLTFVVLALVVQAGHARAFDDGLVRVLRGDTVRPRGPDWLPGAMRDVTALGSDTVLLLFTAAVAGFCLARRQYHAVFLVLAAAIGGDLLTGILKDWFARPRPDIALHLVRVTSPSFPSGHALSSAVVYLTLGSLLAQLVAGHALRLYVMTVAMSLTVLIGLSRVYLGVHYPTDVLGGWAAGVVWALLCGGVAQRLQRKGVVEQPR